jgi:hypothetical protein
VGIYFLIDIRGWVKKNFDFLMVGSAKFLPRKIFLFGATPAINIDRPLICMALYTTGVEKNFHFTDYISIEMFIFDFHYLYLSLAEYASDWLIGKTKRI